MPGGTLVYAEVSGYMWSGSIPPPRIYVPPSRIYDPQGVAQATCRRTQGALFRFGSQKSL